MQDDISNKKNDIDNKQSLFKKINKDYYDEADVKTASNFTLFLTLHQKDHQLDTYNSQNLCPQFKCKNIQSTIIKFMLLAPDMLGYVIVDNEGTELTQ